MKQKRYPTALTIAGSDSGGGAGIQADLKTFSSLGVYATTVITAVTAQNTQGVDAIQPISPTIIQAQCESVCSDIQIDAVKIGMLHSPEAVKVIASILQKYAICHVITDPVMVATSGDNLILEETIHLIQTELFPLTTLLTPNCEEASRFTGLKINSLASLCEAGNRLLEMGCQAVLMKGGHLLSQEKTDVLMINNAEPLYFTSSTISTPNTHGTGCTLSSAITGYLTLGYSLSDSVSHAKKYVHQAIEAGADVYVGAGHGPLNHFFNPSKLIHKSINENSCK